MAFQHYGNVAHLVRYVMQETYESPGENKDD
jgi:hypothetical protein